MKTNFRKLVGQKIAEMGIINPSAQLQLEMVKHYAKENGFKVTTPGDLGRVQYFYVVDPVEELTVEGDKLTWKD